MSIIVAIGGGELREEETLTIDQVIVGLTGKQNPRALFIPTASGDAEGYWEAFREIYQNKLACQTDLLSLVKRNPTADQIREKILTADLIYVGGGNTMKMMEIWREHQVDKYLKEALEHNIVLSGLSAGSICWFKYGHSDSESFAGEGDWSYIRVEGLGFINAFHCPHYNENKRGEDFKRMLREDDGNLTGIALENNTALVIVDDKYRVISSDQAAKAYRLYQKDGQLISEIIEENIKFKKLTELL